MAREVQESRVEIPDATPEGSRRNLRVAGCGVPNATAGRENSCKETDNMMEAVVEHKNMKRAYRQVVSNKGASGVDGMCTEELHTHLQDNWVRIKEELLTGRYTPQPVLRVEIPKPDGKGMRKLGIPVVVDRLVQQAIHQVLSPVFDPGFSESSYGFRPARSAHQALLKAREHVAKGKRWVVDIDLEKFFDQVNHDVLMSRLSRKVKDKRVLRLIRSYLQAGIMEGGLVSQSIKGTPQGGPLSPLLSNIILDDWDKELDRRGHCYCRYADDCNIYVGSKRAGNRVMESISRFLERRLRLKINKEKSTVDRPWKRTFLGFSMTWHKVPMIRVAHRSLLRFRSNLKESFRRGRGQNLQKFVEEIKPLLRGWINYFRLSEATRIFKELDGWIRRRLRCIIWRQWKRSRIRARNLMKRGLPEEQSWRSATNGRGPWWNSGAVHMNLAFPKRYFDRIGLVSLLDNVVMFQRNS